MKRILMGFTICVFLTAACPVLSDAANGDEHAVQAIEQYVNSNAQGLMGVQVKQFNRLGDAAAVAITHLIGQRTLTNDQIEKVLSVLNLAFERPAIVSNSADRKPNATVVLLQKLKGMTSDATILAHVNSAAATIATRTK